MGFKCGIVGLPNVGKSTLFNALTQAGIQAENFPFCTIDPNVGVVPLPDPRLDALSAIVKPQRVIPTSMEFVDIAGLVAGASKGEGLGNQFLAAIRETDAIGHVVRCFEDPNVIHVSGKISPLDDIEVINTELALADLDNAEKQLAKVRKAAKSGDKAAKIAADLLERCVAQLSEGLPLRSLDLDAEACALIKPFCFITFKPVMYIANVDEAGLQGNEHSAKVDALAKTENATMIIVCAAIESELTELDDNDKKDFLQDLGLDEPGLDRVIHAGYKLLGLETYFTAGVKEVRAWTVPAKSTAPQAAGKIHSDFERGFIRAEVIAFKDFIQYKGEQGAKEAGKLRSEGKEYIVKDGDVVHFRFNV